MAVLIDTHIAIWGALRPSKLSQAARDAIEAESPAVYVSVVSLWEIAIKHALGRKAHDPLPFDAAQALEAFRDSNFRILPVGPEHAIAVGGLSANTHADPFDRLLVAQAEVEGMRLVTADTALASYGESVIVV